MQDRVGVVDGRAIVGRSAVASRCGEEGPLVKVLERVFRVDSLAPPACLDWGDVLIGEEELFVGLSSRSNRAAVRQLHELLAPERIVEGVPTPPDLLHLLSGCAYLGRGILLAIESLEDFARARGFEIVPVSPDEPLAANVLAVNDDLLVPDGYPETRARIERAGFRVHAVPVSEFERRDGGVTCLSILF